MSRYAIDIEKAREHVLSPQPGFIYEPRAIWDVQISHHEKRAVQFEAEHFYNSERWPMVLTQVVLCPNVAIPNGRMFPAGFGTSELRARIRGNSNWSRTDIPIRFGANSRSESDPSTSQYVGAPARIFNSAPTINTVRWKFHHELMGVRDGAVEMYLGALAPGFYCLSDIRATVTFHEIGESERATFKGHDRQFEIDQLGVYDVGNPTPYTGTSKYPFPCILRGGPDEGPVSVCGDTPQVFPSRQVFTAAEYLRQNQASLGSTLIQAVSVSFDQRDVPAEWEQGVEDFPLVSPAIALPTKARTVRTGTQHWWWREGAPLALVMPTQTPCLVADLPVPIVLNPGESLDVSLHVPSYAYVPAYPTRGFGYQYPVSNIGLSFCGFAAVEA